MKKVLLLIVVFVCLLAVTPTHAQSQSRVPGFKPSVSGFRFTNSFAQVPYSGINVAGVNMSIGDASNGMCGGMVYAVRDYFEAGLTPSPNATAPSGGPLFNYLSRRLFDSFNLPGGLVKYLHLMNPDLPDHETWLSNAGLAPRGRAWVMIMEEWPKIKADLDQGRLSPLAMIRVKDRDPFKMGQNHQVLAYGYSLNNNNLVINVYDPNYPGNDNVTISLNIGNPQHTTDVSYSNGGTVYCFFRTDYAHSDPTTFQLASVFTADVTGDGRADAIVVDPRTVTVRRSNGTGYRLNEDWTGGAYYGSRGTFFADVTGDGRADAIVVNDNKVVVRRSSGIGFLPNEDWTGGAYYGSRGTFFADVNGDGRADAIVVNEDTVIVRRSNGNGFLPNEDWTGVAYYGSRGTFFADVTGDGRADAIVVNEDTVIVRRSNGISFLPNEDLDRRRLLRLARHLLCRREWRRQSGRDCRQ